MSSAKLTQETFEQINSDSNLVLKHVTNLKNNWYKNNNIPFDNNQCIDSIKNGNRCNAKVKHIHTLCTRHWNKFAKDNEIRNSTLVQIESKTKISIFLIRE